MIINSNKGYFGAFAVTLLTVSCGVLLTSANPHYHCVPKVTVKHHTVPVYVPYTVIEKYPVYKYEHYPVKVPVYVKVKEEYHHKEYKHDKHYEHDKHEYGHDKHEYGHDKHEYGHDKHEYGHEKDHYEHEKPHYEHTPYHDQPEEKKAAAAAAKA